MAYRVVARLKLDKNDYVERGEKVSASDVGGKENLERLASSGSVVTEERYNALFPSTEQDENQAWGTPSNLEQVEGTELEAEAPEQGEQQDESK